MTKYSMICIGLYGNILEELQTEKRIGENVVYDENSDAQFISRNLAYK